MYANAHNVYTNIYTQIYIYICVYFLVIESMEYYNSLILLIIAVATQCLHYFNFVFLYASNVEMIVQNSIIFLLEAIDACHDKI